MKHLNFIKDSDRKALDRINRSCLDMHVLPPPETFVSLEVEDAQGNLVERQDFKSNSWLRNAYNMVFQTTIGMASNALGNAYGAGKGGFANTTGDIASSANSTRHNGDPLIGTLGSIQKGILIGASNRAESVDDEYLSKPYTHGTSAAARHIAYQHFKNFRINAYNFVFNEAETYCAVGTLVAPYIAFFKKVGDQYVQLTDVTIPTPNGATVTNIKCDPTGTYFMAFSGSSPYLCVFKRVGDTVTQCTIPSYPYNTVTYGAIDREGTYFIAGANVGGDYNVIYKRTGDTFALLTTPSNLKYNMNWCDFHSNGLLVTGLNTSASPYFKMFTCANDVWTQVTPPGTLPTSNVYKVAFCPTGNYVYAVVSAGTAYVYKWDGAALTYLTTLTGTVGSTGAPSITADGTWICFPGGTDSKIFKRTGDAFEASATSLSITSLNNARIIDNGQYVIATFAGGRMLSYFLGPQLSYGLSPALAITYDPATKKQNAVLTRVINNNTAVSALINEIGLISYLSEPNGFYMINRDVLPAPITLLAGYKITVTYTISMVFPD